MNINKGIYLVRDNSDNSILLFIYAKLNKTQLAKSLPISFDSDKYDNTNSNYISAVFKNGQDFIGQTNWEETKKFIKGNTNIDLLNNDFQACQNIFPELTLDNYNNQFDFAQTQIEEL
jgi:hypothetical protein